MCIANFIPQMNIDMSERPMKRSIPIMITSIVYSVLGPTGTSFFTAPRASIVRVGLSIEFP